jgi:hypothetical protein
VDRAIPCSRPCHRCTQLSGTQWFSSWPCSFVNPTLTDWYFHRRLFPLPPLCHSRQVDHCSRIPIHSSHLSRPLRRSLPCRHWPTTSSGLGSPATSTTHVEQAY